MGLRTRLHMLGWYASLAWRRRNRPDYTLMRGPGIPPHLLATAQLEDTRR